MRQCVEDKVIMKAGKVDMSKSKHAFGLCLIVYSKTHYTQSQVCSFSLNSGFFHVSLWQANLLHLDKHGTTKVCEFIRPWFVMSMLGVFLEPWTKLLGHFKS